MKEFLKFITAVDKRYHAIVGIAIWVIFTGLFMLILDWPDASYYALGVVTVAGMLKEIHDSYTPHGIYILQLIFPRWLVGKKIWNYFGRKGTADAFDYFATIFFPYLGAAIISLYLV